MHKMKDNGMNKKKTGNSEKGLYPNKIQVSLCLS